LLLHVEPALLDHEIELDASDPAVPRCHSAVRERHIGAQRICAAVYPDLRAGSYTVVGSGQTVLIHGGRITEIMYVPSAVSAH
jgi:hypothetical protein